LALKGRKKIHLIEVRGRIRVVGGRGRGRERIRRWWLLRMIGSIRRRGWSPLVLLRRRWLLWGMRRRRRVGVSRVVLKLGGEP